MVADTFRALLVAILPMWAVVVLIEGWRQGADSVLRSDESDE